MTEVLCLRNEVDDADNNNIVVARHVFIFHNSNNNTDDTVYSSHDEYVNPAPLLAPGSVRVRTRAMSACVFIVVSLC